MLSTLDDQEILRFVAVSINVSHTISETGIFREPNPLVYKIMLSMLALRYLEDQTESASRFPGYIIHRTGIGDVYRCQRENVELGCGSN